MVTSFDTKENVREAVVRLARETVASDPAVLTAKHEQVWQKFWSASGLELGDRFFQDAWYRNLYYMRCFCRPGTTMPITLYAGLVQADDDQALGVLRIRIGVIPALEQGHTHGLEVPWKHGPGV